MSVARALIAAACAAGLPLAAHAGPSVAVAAGSGPKKAVLATVVGALKKGLAADGIDVVDAKPASKKAKVDRKLASAVGATFLVVVDATEQKRKFRAEVQVVRVDDGSSIHEATSEAYSGKAAAAKAGRALADGVVAAINAAAPAAEVVPPPPPADPPPRVIAPSPKSDGRGGEPDDPEPRRSAAPVPKDEKPASRASGEGPPMFEVMVGAGSQASTAYTVLVGGTPTALAYTLSPLLLIDVNARVTVPSTSLDVELAFSLSPVKFALDTEPPVSPAEPGGSFLEIGGAVGWRFQLSGDGRSREGFVLEPLAGLRYESLSVDTQDRPIVLGASAIVPHFGARAMWGATDALVFVADARVRLPLGYSESGATTGDGGSGFGVALGGGARFWVVSSFGLGLNLAYTYTSLSFSGTGTRQLFASDPALVDASVASSNLRLSLGAVLAF